MKFFIILISYYLIQLCYTQPIRTDLIKNINLSEKKLPSDLFTEKEDTKSVNNKENGKETKNMENSNEDNASMASQEVIKKLILNKHVDSKIEMVTDSRTISKKLVRDSIKVNNQLDIKDIEVDTYRKTASNKLSPESIVHKPIDSKDIEIVTDDRTISKKLGAKSIDINSQIDIIVRKDITDTKIISTMPETVKVNNQFDIKHIKTTKTKHTENNNVKKQKAVYFFAFHADCLPGKAKADDGSCVSIEDTGDFDTTTDISISSKIIVPVNYGLITRRK